jgi:hypothetical protein
MARGRTSTITIACAKPGSSIGEAFILGLDFRSTVMDAPEGNAVLFVLKIATAVKTLLVMAGLGPRLSGSFFLRLSSTSFPKSL